MAKKHYLIPASLIQKLPVLRKLSWRIEAVVVKSLVGLLRAMSPEHAARLANFLFRTLKSVLPFTKKVRANFTVAFPDKSKHEIEKLTRDVCGNLGNAVAELVFAERIWAERDTRIEFVTEGDIDLASYRGRPVVMINAHMGAWQIAGFIAAQYKLRMTFIYAPEENPYLRDFVFRLRSALRGQFISRDGCMRGLTKELRQGNAIGLTSDTRLDSGDTLSFFGVPTPTNTTAARLALRNDCEFFPVRAERLPNMKFRITLCRAIRPSDPDAPAAEQARQMTQELLDLFETWIRANPDHWMCFGRRWPHQAYGGTQSAIDGTSEA